MPGRLRVLIVDDHAGVVKSVSRLLKLDCEIVGGITDCGGLLDAVRRFKPDLIVLDMNFPDADGLKACREVTQANPGMKVIVFTAADADDTDARQRALEAGAIAFVDKLAPNAGLLSAVRNLAAGMRGS